MEKQIERFCAEYGLGNLKHAPEPVTGGLMHAMYRVRTVRGEYAIKVLNPNIMKRPTAFQNMVNSERIARKLQDIIPTVVAMSFDRKNIITFEGSHYIVFEWLDGKSVFAPDITNDHCRHIGRILGKIHAADIKIEGMEKRTSSCKVYEWNELLKVAQRENTACFSVLGDHLDDLISWNHRAAEAWDQVVQNQVISHRDLDPKNVMWKDGQTFVIDWEAAGFVNPAQELIEVLDDWISEKDGRYCRDKFETMMQAYTENADVSNVNWDAVLACSSMGMLGWLEYNVKRAVGLEGTGNVERQEGMKQVTTTIWELEQHEAQTAQLRSWIYEYFAKK